MAGAFQGMLINSGACMFSCFFFLMLVSRCGQMINEGYRLSTKGACYSDM